MHEHVFQRRGGVVAEVGRGATESAKAGEVKCPGRRGRARGASVQGKVICAGVPVGVPGVAGQRGR